MKKVLSAPLKRKKATSMVCAVHNFKIEPSVDPIHSKADIKNEVSATLTAWSIIPGRVRFFKMNFRSFDAEGRSEAEN